jgi:hypothetical protein
MEITRRRGRPPKPETERRGRNVTFRTPGGLRARLEDAARIAGRSVSEEVVYRLEKSFLLEDEAREIQEAWKRPSPAFGKLIEALEKHYRGGAQLPQAPLEETVERAVTRALQRLGMTGGRRK